MAVKMDDSTPGVKVLRIFRKLLVDKGKHYQANLAQEFNCSPQTIIRVMSDIENVIGVNLETGLDNRKRWYRLNGKVSMQLGKQSEELRYLSICRDIAADTIAPEALSRMDDMIFNISLHLCEERIAAGKKPQIDFFSKGMIDYKPHMAIIENLSQAIEKTRLCELNYKASGRNEAKNYYFAPASFLSLSQALYIAGAILEEDRITVRHFSTLPIQRIKSCLITERRHNIDFPELESSLFGLPWHDPKLFRIVFKKGRASDYVAERIWSTRQSISYRPDGSLILELVSQSTPEVEAWVRSFGDQIESFETLEEGELLSESY